MFIFINFYLEMILILDLQKSGQDSAEIFCTPFTQILLIEQLAFMLQLLKVRNNHWYKISN